MIELLGGWLAAIGGLVIFGAAYYIHQRVRMTRVACILAAVGGFMTYDATLGSWASSLASARGMAVVTFAAVAVLICIIVANIKGKRKGADKPALFAFFLVPVFFVAFLASMGAVAGELRGGVQKATTNVSSQTGR